MRTYLIYKAACDVTGKCYVGRTGKLLRKRRQEHYTMAVAGAPYHFHKAIRKYGEGSFTWEVLAASHSLESSIQSEIFFISQFDTYRRGYNMTVGGEGVSSNKGRKLSKEHRASLSIGKMGNQNAKGYKHSKGTCEKVRAGLLKLNAKREVHPLKGVKLSEERCAAISKQFMGNTHTLGHKLTEEHKAKISAAGRGKKHSKASLKLMCQKQAGLLNPASRGWITTPEGMFDKTTKAAVHFSMTPGAVEYRCNSNKSRYEGWFFEKPPRKRNSPKR